MYQSKISHEDNNIKRKENTEKQTPSVSIEVSTENCP